MQVAQKRCRLRPGNDSVRVRRIDRIRLRKETTMTTEVQAALDAARELGQNERACRGRHRHKGTVDARIDEHRNAGGSKAGKGQERGKTARQRIDNKSDVRTSGRLEGSERILG